MTGCPRNYVHVSFRCQEFPHPHEFGAGQSEAAEIASRPAFHDQNATAIGIAAPRRKPAYPTGHGLTPQISLAYCRIVRSLENFPDPAML
jgi:hypothetical protein